MKNCRLVVLALAGALVMVYPPRPCLADNFASGVEEYESGTGFAVEFGTGLGYTNPLAALGQPNRDTGFGPVTPFNPPFERSELVSLGTNGSLTVRFDNPLVNDAAHPFGLDFVIYGSAGFIDADYPNGRTDASGSLFGFNPGQTRVWVSAGDGNFFQLNPLFAPVADGLFPTDGAGVFGLPVNPALTSADFANRSLAEIRALYGGGAGGTAFDLAWAVDGAGNPVNLASVSLVRVDVLNGRAEIDGFAAVVPEPGAWALIGLGLAGALGARRWRARR
jgi:hypothetical protein